MKVDPYLGVEYGLSSELIKEMRGRRYKYMNFVLSETFVKKLALSFVRAFAATFLVGAVGIASSPDFSAAKAALIALVVGAITAGLRAVQAIVEGGDGTVT
jgi:hypothetical protein